MIRTQLRARREAERRYPAHVRIAVPPEGLGRQLDIMHAWLNETCGAEGWAKAPAGTTGVVNDPMALYFEDAAVAQAFVARFCCGYRIETIAGAFAIRDDAVKTRRVAAVHKTPLASGPDPASGYARFGRVGGDDGGHRAALHLDRFWVRGSRSTAFFAVSRPTAGSSTYHHYLDGPVFVALPGLWRAVTPWLLLRLALGTLAGCHSA